LSIDEIMIKPQTIYVRAISSIFSTKKVDSW